MKHIFEKKDCDKIINYFEDVNEWLYINEYPSKNYFFYKIDFNDFKTQHNLIYELINNVIVDYVKKNHSLNIKSFTFILLKYEKDQFFSKHVDKVIDSDYHKDAILNVNFLLNDSFTGGDFYLEDKKFVDNKVGVVFSYYSNQPHELKKIESGIRYLVLCYIRERDLIKTNLM